MTDYERGYEQGKADATEKMHPQMRVFWEDYFDKCFTEYREQRKHWFSLTDEEYQTILGRLGDGGLLAFYILIESKLKEKNT
jgi:hypothetical protein